MTDENRFLKKKKIFFLVAQIWVKCARTGCELGLIWWRYKSFSQSMWISQICQGVFWKLLFIKKQSIVNPKKTVNPKYYVKSLERNKVRLSDIRELWKKEKIFRSKIVTIHWQILQLLIFAVPVYQVSKKKSILLR